MVLFKMKKQTNPIVISLKVEDRIYRNYHLSIWDDLKYAQLFPCFPHEPLLLWTHVRTRPNKHLRQVQVCSLGSTCADVSSQTFKSLM